MSNMASAICDTYVYKGEPLLPSGQCVSRPSPLWFESHTRGSVLATGCWFTPRNKQFLQQYQLGTIYEKVEKRRKTPSHHISPYAKQCCWHVFIHCNTVGIRVYSGACNNVHVYYTESYISSTSNSSHTSKSFY